MIILKTDWFSGLTNKSYTIPSEDFDKIITKEDFIAWLLINDSIFFYYFQPNKVIITDVIIFNTPNDKYMAILGDNEVTQGYIVIIGNKASNLNTPFNRFDLLAKDPFSSGGD